MDECEDNLSAEEIQNDDSPLTAKNKPKKRSLVERELETNLTARVTSPVTREGASTSRYGRARRCKFGVETDAEKVMKPLRIDTRPQPQAYKMHASNSPIRKDSRAVSVPSSIEDQIENIYNENMSLSRFGSEEQAKGQSPAKKFPKIYMRKDLTQKPDADNVVLIKNLFSPVKSNTHLNNILERSSEKYSLNGHAKALNGFPDTSSVVKTLDFDGKKKKKDGNEKVVSKNELFDLEASCEYQVGDLAWARVGTYPFWPCIVTREPYTDMFVKKKLFGRVVHDVIHVTFLGDNGRRGWIVDNMLRKYSGRAEFESAREKFTPEAKKKDPRLYAAHFVSEKKLPMWNVSVEEAETFLREPKRLRIEILHDMLDKARTTKTTPKHEKSGKITRTDSDVSLSESLYDTLFSEDDGKADENNRAKKSRNKSLDVSEVVTACLDNMAAKSGIIKIQKQSHMDRWLQKAKSKTPEKSQPKFSIKTEVEKRKDRTKRKPKESRKFKSRKNESLNSEKNLLPYQNEHDYSSVNYENHDINDSSNINTDFEESGYNETLDSSEMGIIAKVESLASSMDDCSQDDIITTVVNDDIVMTDAESISKEIKVLDANDNDKIITKDVQKINATYVHISSIENDQEASKNKQSTKIEVSKNDGVRPRRSKRKRQSAEDKNNSIVEHKAKNAKLDLVELNIDIDTNISNSNTENSDIMFKNTKNDPGEHKQEVKEEPIGLQGIIAPNIDKTSTLKSDEWYRNKLIPLNGPKPVVVIEPLKMIGLDTKLMAKDITQLHTEVKNENALSDTLQKADEMAVIENILVEGLDCKVLKETELVPENKEDDTATIDIPDGAAAINNQNMDIKISEDTVPQNGVDSNVNNCLREEDMKSDKIDLCDHVKLNDNNKDQFDNLQIKNKNFEDLAPHLSTTAISNLESDKRDTVETLRTEVNNSPSELKNKEDLGTGNTAKVVIGEETYIFDRTFSQDYDEIYENNSNEINHLPIVSVTKNDLNNCVALSQDYDEINKDTEECDNLELVLKPTVDLSDEVGTKTSTDKGIKDTSNNDISENYFFEKVSAHKDKEKYKKLVLEGNTQLTKYEDCSESNYQDNKIFDTIVDKKNKVTDIIEEQNKIPKNELLNKHINNNLKSPKLSLRRVKKIVTKVDIKISENDTTKSKNVSSGDDINNDTDNPRNDVKVNNIEDSKAVVNNDTDNPTNDVKVNNKEDSKAVVNNDADNPTNDVKVNNEEDSKAAVNNDTDNPTNNVKISNKEDSKAVVNNDIHNPTNDVKVNNKEDSKDVVNIDTANPTNDVKVNNKEDSKAVVNNDADNPTNDVKVNNEEDSKAVVNNDTDNPTNDFKVNNEEDSKAAVNNDTDNPTNSVKISNKEDSKAVVNNDTDNPIVKVTSTVDFKADVKINGSIESKESSPERVIKEEFDPDTASVKSEDSGVSSTRRRIRSKEKQSVKKAMDDPEFIKYLEFRQDALIDEQPELTQDEIVTYLYQTWLYEESNKSDRKKTDDAEQSNLVKGLNQDPAPQPKKIYKKKPKVEKELNQDIRDIMPKDKPKRKITQTKPYYNEDFSDLEEEDLETFNIFDTDVNAQNEDGEPIDEVELYFERLTKPKPNVFKGFVREKVCEICELTENLVKCKGCHGMFHVDCVNKEEQIVEVPAPTRGRKKKKKPRGRRPKGYDDSIADSESQSDEKSQDANNSEELNVSLEEELESHITIDADYFDTQWEIKMKEILPDTLEGDLASDQEIVWDAPPGQCEIVDMKHKEKAVDYSDFKCKNCQKHETPICFVCKSHTSPKALNEVRQKCQVAHCHRYYHLECLEYWPQTQFNSWEPSKTNKKVIEYIEALSCPRHVCHTCVSDDPRGCKTRFCGDKLARCVRCPATYHSFTKCLPAGTQILTGSQIICPRHYEHRPGKVPCHVNTGWCFICALGGTLICCEYCPTSFHAECLNIKPPEGSYMCEDCETGRLPLYGEMVWVKLGHYRWWPGIVLHPTEIPDNIMAVKHSPGEFVVRFFGQYDHYWVNRGRVFPFQEGDSGKISSQKSKIDAAFTTAMEHAQRACEILKNVQPNEEEDMDIASSLLPPHYVKLKVNKPVGSLSARRDVDANSLTQCECDPALPDPCGPYSHCLNRMLLTECGPLCRAGERCNNRAFERRAYPRLAAARTAQRGWGLRTLEDIRQGQFVIEYVGELIDEEEFRRRMGRKHAARDENYYFLTLDKERMIDAGPKGNLARFMNHCCEPNCETQKWTVLGDVRVGLFALRDIPANSEVTFNYNLECAGIEKKRCLCGAKRCSGYIGAKPKPVLSLEETHPKKLKGPGKRTYKKRKNLEDSPSTSKIKPPIKIKIKPVKPRELTEIEKDLLIIKNATNGMSSDSEGSRLSSVDEKKDTKPLKRKRVSFSTEEVFNSSVKKARVDDKVGD